MGGEYKREEKKHILTLSQKISIFSIHIICYIAHSHIKHVSSDMRNNLSSPYLIEHATPKEMEHRENRHEAGELRGKL